MQRGLRILLVAHAGSARSAAVTLWENERAVGRVYTADSLEAAHEWLKDIQVDAVAIAPDAYDGPKLTSLRSSHFEAAMVAFGACAPGSYEELMLLGIGVDEVVCGSESRAIESGEATAAVHRAVVRRKALLENGSQAIDAVYSRVMEQLQRFLEDAWNRTSHDLATPLTPVLFDLHGLLQRRGDLDPKGQALVERIARNMQRMEDALKVLQSDHPAQQLQRLGAHSVGGGMGKRPQRPARENGDASASEVPSHVSR